MPTQSTPCNDYKSLAKDLRQFVEERDWNQFHTAKNLAVSVSIEAAELLEHFQWKDVDAPDHDTLQGVKDETSDVFLYLILIADRLGFDLLQAATEKLEKNRAKYPPEKCRGSSTKYDKLTSKN